jgi:hypothetical protein
MKVTFRNLFLSYSYVISENYALLGGKGLSESQVPVAHTYNSSYSRDRDWEVHSLRPAWGTSLRDPISKITRAKWTGSVAQAVEHLLCKCEALSSVLTTREKVGWEGELLNWASRRRSLNI